MKTKKLPLPKWMIRSIEDGKEGETLSSIVVGIVALYLVFLMVLFFSHPFGEDKLSIEILVALSILACIVGFGFWFVARISLLISKREEAKIRFKNATTEQGKAACKELLLALNIPA